MCISDLLQAELTHALVSINLAVHPAPLRMPAHLVPMIRMRKIYRVSETISESIVYSDLYEIIQNS
jgi:hypothetical protein